MSYSLAELREDVRRMPKGVLAYANKTNNQGSITSQVDISGLSVTVDVPAGRLIKVEFNVGMSSSVANDRLLIRAHEGSTVLVIGGDFASVANQTFMFSGVAVSEPSAGTHTYKLSAQRASGTGTMTIQASSTNPSYIIVSDVGAA